MILLTQAVLALGRDSAFRRQYDAGMKKDVYWSRHWKTASTLRLAPRYCRFHLSLQVPR